MTLTGFAALQRALVAAPDVVKTHSTTAVAISAYSVAERAKVLVPEDTGTLRRAITSNPSRDGLVSNVGLAKSDFESTYYWRFIEFGTRYKEARPFFRPAAEMESAIFIQRMRAIGPRLERDLSTGRFA